MPVNLRNHEGETALHNAACWGNIKAIETLLEAGDNINALNDDNYPPLVLTFFHAQAKAAQLLAWSLLEKGAKTDVKDGFGQTPLDRALENNRQDIVTLLKSPKKTFTD